MSFGCGSSGISSLNRYLFTRCQLVCNCLVARSYMGLCLHYARKLVGDILWFGEMLCCRTLKSSQKECGFEVLLPRIAMFLSLFSVIYAG